MSKPSLPLALPPPISQSVSCTPALEWHCGGPGFPWRRLGTHRQGDRGRAAPVELVGAWSGLEEARSSRLGGGRDWAEEESVPGRGHSTGKGKQVGVGSMEPRGIKLQALDQAVRPSRHIIPSLLSLPLDSFIHLTSIS